jgi:molybdate transport system regulatory protein
MAGASVVPRFNLWLQRGELVVLSQWRVRLLEAIDETGSIKAAATRLEVPYHRAWDKLNEMETGLEVRLVERWTGGTGGGQARLTEAGRDYVARFNRLAQGLDELVVQRFEQEFGGE